MAPVSNTKNTLFEDFLLLTRRILSLKIFFYSNEEILRDILEKTKTADQHKSYRHKYGTQKRKKKRER